MDAFPSSSGLDGTCLGAWHTLEKQALEFGIVATHNDIPCQPCPCLYRNVLMQVGTLSIKAVMSHLAITHLLFHKSMCSMIKYPLSRYSDGHVPGVEDGPHMPCTHMGLWQQAPCTHPNGSFLYGLPKGVCSAIHRCTPPPKKYSTPPTTTPVW